MPLTARDMSGAVRRTSSMGSKPEMLAASKVVRFTTSNRIPPDRPTNQGGRPASNQKPAPSGTTITQSLCQKRKSQPRHATCWGRTFFVGRLFLTTFVLDDALASFPGHAPQKSRGVARRKHFFSASSILRSRLSTSSGVLIPRKPPAPAYVPTSRSLEIPYSPPCCHGIPNDRCSRCAWHDLLEQLEPFAGEALSNWMKPLVVPPGCAMLSTKPFPTDRRSGRTRPARCGSPAAAARSSRRRQPG